MYHFSECGGGIAASNGYEKLGLQVGKEASGLYKRTTSVNRQLRAGMAGSWLQAPSSFLSWVIVSETAVWVKFTFLSSSLGPTGLNGQRFLLLHSDCLLLPVPGNGIICAIVSGAPAEVGKRSVSFLCSLQSREGNETEMDKSNGEASLSHRAPFQKASIWRWNATAGEESTRCWRESKDLYKTFA